MSSKNRAATQALVSAGLVGIAQGIIISGALFIFEVIILERQGISKLGAPVSTIASLFLTLGAVGGACAGIVAGLLSQIFGVSAARLSFPVLAWFHLSLFALRSFTKGELETFPWALIVVLIVGGLVVFGALVWARRAPSPSSVVSLRRPAVFDALAIAATAALAGWGPVRTDSLPARQSARADAPNILFILVDAMRADRLSAAGYARPTTPVVDRLAAEGVLFENAYAHGNRTIISVPALFTSLYPALTGAIGFQELMAPLPERQVTIAELCRDAGYSTIGMMNNTYLMRSFGLAQGFDRLEEFNRRRFDLSVYRLLVALGLVKKPGYVTGMYASATEVTDAALKWLSRASREGPVFCYVHYMDVHHPYRPPDEFERMFRTRGSLARIDPNALFEKSVDLVKRHKRDPLDDDELARLRDLYDGCVRYVDTQVGRLVEASNAFGNGRPTVVVFTADHGDEFQEHGSLYHNNVVIQELIRVPLVIWFSDRRFGARVPHLVRHIDLLPTIAELVGAKVPEVAMGRTLTGTFDGADSTAVTSIAEGDYCSAIVEAEWKLMRVDTTGTETLYHLTDDPWAKRDVSLEYPAHRERLSALLEGYLRAVEALRARPSETYDAETMRQLRSLGYIN